MTRVLSDRTPRYANMDACDLPVGMDDLPIPRGRDDAVGNPMLIAGKGSMPAA
jgi:hypothetical protein